MYDKIDETLSKRVAQLKEADSAVEDALGKLQRSS